MEACAASVEDGTPVSVALPISNVDRTVGTLLGSEISRRYGAAGLPDDTISLTFTGSAGQSFGAFVPRGMTMRLFGDANDYFGKGLSGGRLVVRPQVESVFAAEDQIIAGNVILYGATAGEAFIRGQVGERFCVRNSGAVAVVEGVGDHGCEYMTGGRVVVLGPRPAAISPPACRAAIAYIYDPERTFGQRVNLDMVDVEPLNGEDSFLVRSLVERHGVETDSAVAARLLEHWEIEQTRVRQGHATGLPAHLEATRLAEAEGRSVDDAVMEAATLGRPVIWVSRPVSWSSIARCPGGARSRCACATGARCTSPSPPSRPRSRGRAAWTAASPSATRAARSAISSPSGTTWSTRTTGPTPIERLHATNNFPEFTGRLCPAPCEAACVLGINEDPVTIERIEYEIIERAWSEGWVDPATRHRAHRTLGGRGRVRAGRSGRGPTTGAGRSRRDGVRAGREAGWPAALRHPRVQDGESACWTAAWPRWKPRASPSSAPRPSVAPTEPRRRRAPRLRTVRSNRAKSGARQGLRPRRHRALGRRRAGAVRRRGAWPVGQPCPVTFRCRDETSTACTSPSSTSSPRNLVREGALSASPINAQGKRVIIIGGGDTGADCLGTAHRQGAASVHQFEILPEPPQQRSDTNPWPLWPLILRTSSAHEEGGRARASP